MNDNLLDQYRKKRRALLQDNTIIIILKLIMIGLAIGISGAIAKIYLGLEIIGFVLVCIGFLIIVTCILVGNIMLIKRRDQKKGISDN